MNYEKKSQKNEKVFMSFSKICYGYNIDPVWALEKWLSEPTTLEFIQLWESLHNIDFKKKEYIDLCSEALGTGAAPDVFKLISACKVCGINIKTFDSAEIFLHKDLAIDFASWASPAFRTYCLLLMQKNWSESQCQFKSEEDFVISSKSLAQFTQAEALQNFKSLVGKFVYNYQCV